MTGVPANPEISLTHDTPELASCYEKMSLHQFEHGKQLIRGEQVELLVTHAVMMSRPIGLSNAGTAAVHFSRQNLADRLKRQTPLEERAQLNFARSQSEGSR
jgi:hypothetical protein